MALTANPLGDIETTDTVSTALGTTTRTNFDRNMGRRVLDVTVDTVVDDWDTDPATDTNRADVIICTSGVGETITLPTAADNAGRVLTIIQGGAGAVTIDGDGSETISGAASIATTSRYDFRTVLCDGTEWFVIGTN